MGLKGKFDVYQRISLRRLLELLTGEPGRVSIALVLLSQVTPRLLMGNRYELKVFASRISSQFSSTCVCAAFF